MGIASSVCTLQDERTARLKRCRHKCDEESESVPPTPSCASRDDLAAIRVQYVKSPTSDLYALEFSSLGPTLVGYTINVSGPYQTSFLVPATGAYLFEIQGSDLFTSPTLIITLSKTGCPPATRTLDIGWTCSFFNAFTSSGTLNGNFYEVTMSYPWPLEGNVPDLYCQTESEPISGILPGVSGPPFYIQWNLPDISGCYFPGPYVKDSNGEFCSTRIEIEQ